MRTVVCDFCGGVLTDHAWDCPCEDFDYGEQRTGLRSGEVVDGSIGSWLACARCALCVTNGDRVGLTARGVVGNYGRWLPDGSGVAEITDAQITDLRILHDQFWEHRLGAPVRISRAQLDLIASDPATKREPR